jgi:hypothetical protein
MSNKLGLIDYLTKHGKDLSWHELAKAFSFTTGDAARHAWDDYKAQNQGASIIKQPAKNPGIFAAIAPKNAQAKEQYTMDLEDKITKYEEDLTKGTAQVEALVGQEIKTLEELVDKCKIDLTKWEITRWVQNFWNNKYQVKAFLAPKQEKNIFQENLLEFLKTYKPEISVPKAMEITEEALNCALRDVDCKTPIQSSGSCVDWDTIDYAPEERITERRLPNGCLIINKQDFHFDKLDVYGDNNIDRRFNNFRNAVNRVTRKTKLSYNVTEIIYILGSDAFNCEWTGMTTKGTPQKNMVDYHNGFQAICDHEIRVINDLINTTTGTLKVLYIPGNHDEYVGWHLVQVMSAIFKGNKKVEFAIDPSYRKYFSFGNSIMMFNHGDMIKPEKLASIFPQEAKEGWSASSYQYIFTGDKHHEKTLDMDGIMFYQLTQSSNATSQWDSKQGFQARGFLTAFVVSEDYGIGDVLKERL